MTQCTHTVLGPGRHPCGLEAGHPGGHRKAAVAPGADVVLRVALPPDAFAWLAKQAHNADRTPELHLRYLVRAQVAKQAQEPVRPDRPFETGPQKP